MRVLLRNVLQSVCRVVYFALSLSIGDSIKEYRVGSTKMTCGKDDKLLFESYGFLVVSLVVDTTKTVITISH